MSFARKETSFVTKVVASVVSFAAALFMLGLMSIPAQAQQSNAELRAQIQGLLDTISQLQAQVDGQGSSSGTAAHAGCSAEFTQNLSTGDRGNQVMQLQKFLNGESNISVASAGQPGSSGNETSYFGPATKAAVTAFQNKYSSEVLAPVGLSSGTGYWGPSSRKKANAICDASVVDTGGDDDDDDSDDDSDDSDDSDDDEELSGGEASLEDFDIKRGNDRDIVEGDSGEIADIEFDVEDGDVRVARADLTFGASASNNSAADTEPWDVFEEVTLLDEDGDEVASVDVGDEDDWKDDDPISDSSHSLDNNVDYYQLRLTKLNTIVRENDTAEFTVEVETQNNVDDAQNSPEWEVAVLDDGIRARDGEGIDQYTGDDSDSVRFDIEEEGQGEELSFSESSNNPDSSILPVETNDISDDYGVFVFEVEADESDIEIDDLPLTFSTYSTGTAATTTFDDVVDEAYLEFDGNEYEYDNESSGGSANVTVDGTSRTVSTSTLEFNDMEDDFVVEEDEEVEVTLFVSFRQQNNNYDEGSSVKAEMTDTNRDNVRAEGADNIGTNDMSGTPSGEIHDLRTEGVFIESNSTSASVNNNYDNNGNSKATYQVKFDLTAFEEDFFVPKGAVREATAGNVSSRAGARYTLRDSSGNSVATSTSQSLQSSASVSSNSNAWRVDEGDTETFTLNVTANSNNGLSGFHSVQLEAARYANSASNAGDTNAGNESEVRALPLSDFETDSVDL